MTTRGWELAMFARPGCAPRRAPRRSHRGSAGVLRLEEDRVETLLGVGDPKLDLIGFGATALGVGMNQPAAVSQEVRHVQNPAFGEHTRGAVAGELVVRASADDSECSRLATSLSIRPPTAHGESTSSSCPRNCPALSASSAPARGELHTAQSHPSSPQASWGSEQVNALMPLAEATVRRQAPLLWAEHVQ